MAGVVINEIFCFYSKLESLKKFAAEEIAFHDKLILKLCKI